MVLTLLVICILLIIPSEQFACPEITELMVKYSTHFLHLILKAQFDYFLCHSRTKNIIHFEKWLEIREREKKCWLMRLNSEMYITGAGRKKAPCDELQMVTGQSKSLRWLRRITTKHFSYPTHSNHMTL